MSSFEYRLDIEEYAEYSHKAIVVEGILNTKKPSPDATDWLAKT